MWYKNKLQIKFPINIKFHKSRLGTTLLGEVMQQLESTGMCDCSIANTMYAIAAYVTTYEWGIQSVWVYIGYMYDENDVMYKSNEV